MKKYIFVDGISSHFLCLQSNIAYLEYETNKNFDSVIYYTHTNHYSRISEDVFDQIMKQVKKFCHLKTSKGGIYFNKKYLGAAYFDKSDGKYYICFTKHGDLVKKLSVEPKTYKKLYSMYFDKQEHENEKDKIKHKEKMFMKMKEATAEQLEKLANHITMLKNLNDPDRAKKIEKLEAKYNELKA